MRLLLVIILVIFLAIPARNASWFILDLFMPWSRYNLKHCHNCSGSCDNVTVEFCHSTFKVGDVKCLTLVEGDNITKKCVSSDYSCPYSLGISCELCESDLCNRRRVNLTKSSLGMNETANLVAIGSSSANIFQTSSLGLRLLSLSSIIFLIL